MIKVYKDGDKWCAFVGENLQEGCSGFGDSPISALGALINANSPSDLNFWNQATLPE